MQPSKTTLANSGYSTSSGQGHLYKSTELLKTSQEQKNQDNNTKPQKRQSPRKVTYLFDGPGIDDKNHLLQKTLSKVLAFYGISYDQVMQCIEKAQELAKPFDRDILNIIPLNSTKGEQIVLIEFKCIPQDELKSDINRLKEIVRFYNKKRNLPSIKLLPISTKIRFEHNHEFEFSLSLFGKLDIKIQKQNKVMRFANILEAANLIVLLDAIGYSIKLNTPTQVEDKLPKQQEIEKLPKTIQGYGLTSIRFYEVKTFASETSLDLIYVCSRISLILKDGMECEISQNISLEDDQYDSMQV